MGSAFGKWSFGFWVTAVVVLVGLVVLWILLQPLVRKAAESLGWAS